MENGLQNINTDIEATPSALLQLAVQQNLDIEKLEKLMQLQERWQAQQARKEFLGAVSQFQATCPTLEKTKKVEFTNKAGYKTKYNYASLGDIVESIKKPLSEQGLSFRWEIQENENKIIVTCIISHLLGHSEKTTMSATKDESGQKNDIQQRGSAITYLQRYTLIAALGISTADEDTDGRKEEKEPMQKNNTHSAPVKENVMSIVTEPSDIDKDQKQEPIPGHWFAKLEKCKTPEDVDILGVAHKETVNANPELRKMFVKRKAELKPVHANHLPF